MPGPVKTEGIVLRSMRYGEADRILHLYTPHRGRVGAIAKGVRRARSRSSQEDSRGFSTGLGRAGRPGTVSWRRSSSTRWSML